jgi:hypothetical protein
MLRRFSRPSETREYNVILNRFHSGKYDVSELEEKDRKAVRNYIDTLILNGELISDNSDQVLVNLKETHETLVCRIKIISERTEIIEKLVPRPIFL